MPHFIIDASEHIFTTNNILTILERLHNCAVQSGIFNEKDIKIRIREYDEYSVGGTNQNFIHVFAYIMEGRTMEQKAALSKSMVKTLSEMFPQVQTISMNVKEFEKATYCNRYLLS